MTGLGGGVHGRGAAGRREGGGGGQRALPAHHHQRRLQARQRAALRALPRRSGRQSGTVLPAFGSHCLAGSKGYCRYWFSGTLCVT